MSKIATSKGIFVLELPSGVFGEHPMICPICTPTRKPEHQKEKKFSINLGKDPAPWRCNHCKESGYILTEDYMNRVKIKPVLKNFDYISINDKLSEWFWTQRKLSITTLRHFDITMSEESIMQQRVVEGSESMQGKWAVRKCINFKYKMNKVLINIKFRDPNKNFKMLPGATLIPFNIDSVLSKDVKQCVITEGEPDAMAYHEAGIETVISVPNGASITPDEKEHYIRTGEIKVMSNINLTYLDPVIDELKHIETFYIATDDDAPGIKLREELARRLGYERCKYIKFSDYKTEEGKEINDPNELLIKKGKTTLASTLDSAQTFPISGVTEASQYTDKIIKNYREGKEKGISTGYLSLDPFFNWMRGWMYIFNGFPGMGKTSVVLDLISVTAVKYKWKWGIYCPENYPVEDVIEIIAMILVGKPVDPGYEKRMTEDELRAVIVFINKHFFFVDEEDGYTPADLREIKKQMIRQHGIVGFLSDPWSALNHKFGKFSNVDDYLQNELNYETRLTTKYRLINLICHHPKTPKSKADALEPPTSFELTGGQRWWSKSYGMATIHQEKSEEWFNNKVGIHIQKMKDKQRAGHTSNMSNYPTFRYDMLSRRLYEKEDPEKDNSKYTRFPFASYLDGDQNSLFDGF